MAFDSQGSWVTLRCMIPLGYWLFAVQYPGEIFTKNLNNSAIPKIVTKIENILTPFSVTQAFLNYEKRTIPVIWLAGVWHPGEIDSAQYHTPGRFRKIRITWRKIKQNRKYFNPLVSGPGWFKQWKKLEVKNLVGLSLLRCQSYLINM